MRVLSDSEQIYLNRIDALQRNYELEKRLERFERVKEALRSQRNAIEASLTMLR